MQTVRTYKQGGFFGNSFEKFEDMPGSEKTGSMFDKNRFGFGTKGGALRREKRYLKDLEDRGGLQGSQAERLDYLKKVQKDRAKKIGAGIGAAALIAGTAGLATGALGAGAAGAGAAGAAGGAGAAGAGAGAAGAGAAGAAGGAAGAGASGLAGATTMGDKILKGLKIAKAGKDLIEPTAKQQEEIDTGNFGQADMYGKYGMRILKGGGLVGGQKRLDKNSDGKLTREDFELLRAMFGAKLPR